MELKNDVKQLLKQYLDYIQMNKFTTIYENLEEFCDNSTPTVRSLVGEFTQALLAAGINPIESDPNLMHIPYAYLHDTDISSFKVPSVVTFISPSAFEGCSSLKMIDFSQAKNLNGLGSDCFSGCTELKEIDLSQTQVDWISDDAFQGCLSLEKAILPKTMIKIDQFAFDVCQNLIELDFLGTKEEWNKIQLDPNWNENSALERIKCADGIITL